MLGAYICGLSSAVVPIALSRICELFVNCCFEIASRQRMSCFCLEIVVGGDDVVPLQLFNKLLDGLLKKGWTRGSEFEEYRDEYPSFVLEQRQPERSSTLGTSCRSALVRLVSVLVITYTYFLLYPLVYDILHFHVLFSIAHETVRLQVCELTALVTRGPVTRGEKFTINLDRVAIKNEEVRGVPLCVQDFVLSSQITHNFPWNPARQFFLGLWRLPVASHQGPSMLRGV